MYVYLLLWLINFVTIKYDFFSKIVQFSIKYRYIHYKKYCHLNTNHSYLTKCMHSHPLLKEYISFLSGMVLKSILLA